MGSVPGIKIDWIYTPYINENTNLSVFEIGLVADDNEREVDGPARTSLNEEQIVPVVQLLERLG